MAVSIHPLAHVDPGAKLGVDVVVGPFAVIEGDCEIGDGCRVEAHAVIAAGSRIGRRNVVHSFAVIGGAPQDRRYAGEPTTLVVGDDNVFREHVTAHRGTGHGGGVTRIGSAGLFMVGVHVAHDVVVGDRVTLANGTLLAGHVVLGDHVVTGGHVAVAPFVRVGARAFLAGGSMVERDVPPFVIAEGNRARVRALNRVGLERTGVPLESRVALKRAFRALFVGELPRAEALARLESVSDPFVRELVAFLRALPRR
ncbi:acyl-ACP--UDP-N-acetylglucosamine O-acyltransferase [Polyangium sorediatum]|uniref:Acyl-ACP--UDP-N-acetylglucosamine O-acyltransferase n=1 Tax=Polyangium sorediatum TaxID=889274 RepID=A0ABT6NTY4_9BACT|nr:acyl-ACP--UDP-N-acetylglucosamine O-acyltransferase [Polyangium sorediatum]MDI1431779.1 acyl-ACP--UDP-N-acetylglucosamine O-acyltransferase [Polyangium sorediatum]